MTLSAKFATQAKCAVHAEGEFNLAALKSNLAMERKRNNLALHIVQNLAKQNGCKKWPKVLCWKRRKISLLKL